MSRATYHSWLPLPSKDERRQHHPKAMKRSITCNKRMLYVYSRKEESQANNNAIARGLTERWCCSHDDCVLSSE